MRVEHQWGRLRTLALIGIGCAALAFVIGFRGAAAGILAGLPISLVNYYLVYSAMQGLGDRPGPRAAFRLMQRMMLRLVLSGAILLAAAPLGLEVLLGALIGVLAEVLLYFGDAVRAALGKG
ncbi:MAG TPA: hypothetical protein VIK93_08350 [Limnochordales bacterium]